MEKINILEKINCKLITLEEIERLTDLILESDEAKNYYDIFMLDKLESTAYSHGISFEDLAKWRYLGWPKKCHKCQKDIFVNDFGWRAYYDDFNFAVIKHIVCH